MKNLMQKFKRFLLAGIVAFSFVGTLSLNACPRGLRTGLSSGEYCLHDCQCQSGDCSYKFISGQLGDTCR